MHLVLASTGFSADRLAGLLFGSFAAVVLLTVLLPFAASMLLDGLVLVLRGRGYRGLVVAALLTAAAATLGMLALYKAGPDGAAGFGTSASFLLPWSCALAVLAFVMRQVKWAMARRRRVAR